MDRYVVSPGLCLSLFRTAEDEYDGFTKSDTAKNIMASSALTVDG